MTIRVTLAGPDESPLVAELMAEFRDWQGRPEPSDASLREAVARLIAGADTEYLLAATPDGDRPQGVCQLRFRYGIWHAADDCWLEDLFVRADARGRGVGGALVEAAVERALRRGCPRIDLDTTSDNASALALYERFGFSSDAGDGARTLMLRRTLAPRS